jgi:two-component system sensor histidine kinase PilS (NtrC family)
LRNQKGHILIFQDLTEIKLIEEEMKKVEGLAIIGELAAGIAHEIRNPLASISGSIQMLKDGLEKKDDVNSRLMDIMSREINRLNHLVNDFLRFARPTQTSLQEFDLNQLILESLELFKNSQHWTDRIEVVTNFGHSIRLESDPEQVKQILWNLFLNACEAMSDGGSLHIMTDLEPDGSQSEKIGVKIVVRDTGNGFDKSALSQLFTPFFTTKEGGSGLGLASVKRIVEGLKGEVHGRNHPEGGAEVTILLSLSPFNSPSVERD